MTEPTEQDDNGPSDSEGSADPYTSFLPFTFGDFIDVPDSPQRAETPPDYWEGPYSVLPYQWQPNLLPDAPTHNPEFPPFNLGDLIHLPDSPEPSSIPPRSLSGDVHALPYQWPLDLFPDRPDPPDSNPDKAFLLACPPVDTLHTLSCSENDRRRLLSDYHDSLDILNHYNSTSNNFRDPTTAPDNHQRAQARDCLLRISEGILKTSQSSVQRKQTLLEESEHWLKRTQRLQTADAISSETQSRLKDSFRRQWENTWARMVEMEELKKRHAKLREEYAKAGGSVDPRVLVNTEGGLESDNLYARIWGMQSLFVEKGDAGEVEKNEDEDENEDEDDGSEEAQAYNPWRHWEKGVEADAVTEEDAGDAQDEEEEEHVNLFTGQTVHPYPRGSWETQPLPGLPAQREESVMDLLAMQHAAFPSHERNRNDPATWRPYTRSSGYGIRPSRLATILEEEYHNPADYLPLFLTAFDDQMSLRDPLMDAEWAISNERGAMDIDEDSGGKEQSDQVSKKGKERAVDPEPPERLIPPAKEGVRLAKPFFQDRSATRPPIDTQSRAKRPVQLRVMNPDEQPPEPNVTQRDSTMDPAGVSPELGRRARQLKEDELRFKKTIKEAMPSGSGPSAARSSAARSSGPRSSIARSSVARSSTRRPSAAGPSAAGPSAAGPSAAGPSASRPSGARAPAAGPSAAGSSTVPSAPGPAEARSDVHPAFLDSEAPTPTQRQDPNAAPLAGSETPPAAGPVVPPAEYTRNGVAYKWLAGMYQRMGQSEEYPIDVD
ncbi:hypothetical protein LTS09_002677 [Friedmanniomyces endolithicus]|nr:hypothetical protein LTS09_002677 [Friedmanniomyces endolithicus]